MLQHLTIRHLAIIKEADITFGPGMTVITGETGAGKSILMNALNLILGHRADSSLIQPGQEKAEICASFSIEDLPAAVLWLSDLDLAHDDEYSCLLRRVIYQNGRSKNYINGTPCTIQQLKLIGTFLVQMHGQHKHQLLLQPREQQRILDVFGKHDADLDAIKTLYYKLDDLLQRKAQQDAGEARNYQIDLLQYQIEEIEALGLQKNELEQLYQLHDQLAQADNTLEACQNALLALDNEAQGNALQLVMHAKQAIQSLFEKYDSLGNVQTCLDNALIQLNETISELNTFIQQLEVDPEKLQTIITRVDKIHDIARKHKIEPDALLDYHAELKKTLEQLQEQTQADEDIDNQIELFTKQYHKLATVLSQKRNRAAKKLSQQITKHIQTLAMSGAQFKVICDTSQQLSPYGLDDISFCISANAGHPPKPIQRVASGGELSRISLALELATLKDSCAPALIFDEVDVGIGGKTGAIVGQSLQQLSQNQQVICITHLPQVAAFGDQHFYVAKQKSGKQTTTKISVLNKEQRIDEIARMLGGIEVSAEARAQAKHLLAKEQEQTEHV